MFKDYRERMHEAARVEVARLIETSVDFSLDSEQPPEVTHQRKGGGTNFVLWGHLGDQSVIYKFFHPDWGSDRYRNEMACLQHFAPTGWVPRVHAAVPETLIAMSCLPGRFIDREVASGELSQPELARLGCELGEAVGAMVDLKLPEQGPGYSVIRDYAVIPWNPDLRRAIEFYLELCRRTQHDFPTGSDPFYQETLALVENQVDRIASQKYLIYHEDFHCFAHNGKLSGVFDLEMARLGTELMQLERVFRQCKAGGLSWSDVLSGYQAETGRSIRDEDYVSMLAMGLFYFHIRIVRWGTPDGKADYVAEHLPYLREEATRYVDYVDLDKYLPSLHQHSR